MPSRANLDDFIPRIRFLMSSFASHVSQRMSTSAQVEGQFSVIAMSADYLVDCSPRSHNNEYPEGSEVQILPPPLRSPQVRAGPMGRLFGCPTKNPTSRQRTGLSLLPSLSSDALALEISAYVTPLASLTAVRPKVERL
jgi:hypothetical protein